MRGRGRGIQLCSTRQTRATTAGRRGRRRNTGHCSRRHIVPATRNTDRALPTHLHTCTIYCCYHYYFYAYTHTIHVIIVECLAFWAATPLMECMLRSVYAALEDSCCIRFLCMHIAYTVQPDVPTEHCSADIDNVEGQRRWRSSIVNGWKSLQRLTLHVQCGITFVRCVCMCTENVRRKILV